MKDPRLGVGLTIFNLLLLVFLLAQLHRVGAQGTAPVLRGRELQIVDDQGNARAELLVHGPETVNGKTYPETVLFRMMDQNKRPVVKFTASADGAALGMSDDSGIGKVHLNSRRDTGNFVRVVSRDGKEQVIKP